MATREVCIWKAPGRESIHFYYARALAYLSRLPAGIFPPRGSRQYFRLSGKSASRSEKERGRRKATWRTLEAWNNTPNFCASSLGCDDVSGMTRSSYPRSLFHNFLSLSSSTISFLSPSHLNFCPKPWANLCFTFLLSEDQEDDSGKFRSLKSFAQFEPSFR